MNAAHVSNPRLLRFASPYLALVSAVFPMPQHGQAQGPATSSGFGGYMRVDKVSFRSGPNFGRALFCRLVLAICAIGLALALTGARPVSAQVLYGSVVGNVVDQHGSVIAGAAVTATNQSTGVAANTTTNGAG